MLIDLPINGKIKSLEAVVRRTQETAHENYFGYGIEFHYKNSKEKKELKEYIGTLNYKIQ